ncbi:electron transfer flavoprotein beta-subunit [Aeropyrum pernix K1]|uniref:Electron transfer flavoprotein beta-subunit n=1 Tax=Aeropyrum pernix (strain ATCC 700893 / DSM 11879 / JCM 9820 / NBRC 100138 / K1) TaxID=272557 RepID=Q9YFW6_AERPE|nr:electron transfer flavoprotein subunit beta/FixA family protein [Aeropyrum pernix]BAA79045.2 electron transfer flavoprotein beta-subunit [Aeropyrum pernix K1]
MPDIAVLVKASLNPDMARIGPDDSVDLNSIPLKISDIDRNAVEEAVKLKEKLGGKLYAVSVLTWGPVKLRNKDLRLAVQEALAKGVDEAIVVADDELTPGDQTTTAKAIKAALEKHGVKPELILAGEATIDEVTSQVPGRLASLLGYKYLSFVRKLDVDNGRIIAERDLEDYIEVVEASLPAVVSVTQEINEPRPPTLLQIRRAARKPVKEYSASELENVGKPVRRIVQIRGVQVKRKQQIIEGDNLEEIAEKLIEALAREGVLKL